MLPLLHYILLDYSAPLATHFVTRGYELYGKRDSRFLELVYSLLLKEFAYKPKLSRLQFLQAGFAEQKLIFLQDVASLCKTLHRNLQRSSRPGNHHGSNSAKMSQASFPMSSTTQSKSVSAPDNKTGYEKKITPGPNHQHHKDSQKDLKHTFSQFQARDNDRESHFSPELDLKDHLRSQANSPFPDFKSSNHQETRTDNKKLKTEWIGVKDSIKEDARRKQLDSDSVQNHAPSRFVSSSYAWRKRDERRQLEPRLKDPEITRSSLVPSDQGNYRLQQVGPEQDLTLSDLDEISKSQFSQPSPLSKFNVMRVQDSPTGPIALSSPLPGPHLPFAPNAKNNQSAFSRDKNGFGRFSNQSLHTIAKSYEFSKIELQPQHSKTEWEFKPQPTQASNFDHAKLLDEIPNIQHEIWVLKLRQDSFKEEILFLRRKLEDMLVRNHPPSIEERNKDAHADVSKEFGFTKSSLDSRGNLPLDIKLVLEKAEENLLRTSSFLAKNRTSPFSKKD